MHWILTWHFYKVYRVNVLWNLATQISSKNSSALENLKIFCIRLILRTGEYLTVQLMERLERLSNEKFILLNLKKTRLEILSRPKILHESSRNSSVLGQPSCLKIPKELLSPRPTKLLKDSKRFQKILKESKRF